MENRLLHGFKNVILSITAVLSFVLSLASLLNVIVVLVENALFLRIKHAILESAGFKPSEQEFILALFSFGITLSILTVFGWFWLGVLALRHRSRRKALQQVLKSQVQGA